MKYLCSIPPHERSFRFKFEETATTSPVRHALQNKARVIEEKGEKKLPDLLKEAVDSLVAKSFLTSWIPNSKGRKVMEFRCQSWPHVSASPPAM